jgi:glycosyltransferase involved in cell wall biosynthesis
VALRSPYLRPDGGALRTFHLSRELAARYPCHLATFSPPDDAEQVLLESRVFRSITHLPTPQGRPSALRHLRASDKHYWRRTYASGFAGARARLQELVRELDVSIVVATDVWLAEFVATLEGIPRIVDVCDSVWLTLQRQMRIDGGAGSWRERLGARLHAARMGRLEGSLTSRVELVTAVAPADCAAIQRLSRTRPDAVRLVPNGVTSMVTDLPPRAGDEVPDSVAFWGNLDFPANRESVRYFFHRIFLPHLKGTGISVRLIGPNPGPELLQAARDYPEIQVTGYVEDLFALVGRVSVVINPMVSGSGIKNKVLEAFGLRRAVVSTRLGMEGIQATPGVHYVEADDPAEFATSIKALLAQPARREALGCRARDLILQRYTWSAIGDQWRDAVADVIRQGRIVG